MPYDIWPMNMCPRVPMFTAHEVQDRDEELSHLKEVDLMVERATRTRECHSNALVMF